MGRCPRVRGAAHGAHGRLPRPVLGCPGGKCSAEPQGKPTESVGARGGSSCASGSGRWCGQGQPWARACPPMASLWSLWHAGQRPPAPPSPPPPSPTLPPPFPANPPPAGMEWRWRLRAQNIKLRRERAEPADWALHPPVFAASGWKPPRASSKKGTPASPGSVSAMAGPPQPIEGQDTCSRRVGVGHPNRHPLPHPKRHWPPKRWTLTPRLRPPNP